MKNIILKLKSVAYFRYLIKLHNAALLIFHQPNKFFQCNKVFRLPSTATFLRHINICSNLISFLLFYISLQQMEMEMLMEYLLLLSVFYGVQQCSSSLFSFKLNFFFSFILEIIFCGTKIAPADFAEQRIFLLIIK